VQDDLRKPKMADFDLSANFIPSLHKPASLLPIARHKQTLLYLIETYPVTIVVGQTGSGKTTQICQYLEQAGWCSDGKIIGVTQVRNLLRSPTKRLTFSSLVE
jgi:ATP-dependent RNA helicase DDX35